jgi:DNA-binding NarL/FixJ family response regulator
MNEPGMTGEIRVLVVDDHPVVRQGVMSLLGRHPDITVVGEAEDGAEVLPFLAEHEVDVILIDIKMRGQNGIDVARRIVRSYPDIKIIILTTYDDESYLHEALEAGVHGFLLKSVSHEILPDSIRSVVAGERLISPGLMSSVLSSYQKLAQEQALQEAGLEEVDLKILGAIAEGASTKDLSESFYMSEATVKRKIQEILEKLGATNRAQAIAEAVRRGWI